MAGRKCFQGLAVEVLRMLRQVGIYKAGQYSHEEQIHLSKDSVFVPF